MASRTVDQAYVDAGGFDVWVKTSIGRVRFGEGDLHPHVAAFHLIGEAMEDGEYSFPMEDGRTCVVRVDIVGEYE